MNMEQNPSTGSAGKLTAEQEWPDTAKTYILNNDYYSEWFDYPIKKGSLLKWSQQQEKWNVTDPVSGKWCAAFYVTDKPPSWFSIAEEYAPRPANDVEIMDEWQFFKKVMIPMLSFSKGFSADPYAGRWAKEYAEYRLQYQQSQAPESGEYYYGSVLHKTVIYKGKNEFVTECANMETARMIVKALNGVQAPSAGVSKEEYDDLNQKLFRRIQEINSLEAELARTKKHLEILTAPQPSPSEDKGGIDENEIIAKVTEVMRDADNKFPAIGGGGPRHYVRDFFIPLLKQAGLSFYPAPSPAPVEEIETKPIEKEGQKEPTTEYEFYKKDYERIMSKQREKLISDLMDAYDAGYRSGWKQGGFAPPEYKALTRKEYHESLNK